MFRRYGLTFPIFTDTSGAPSGGGPAAGGSPAASPPPAPAAAPQSPPPAPASPGAAAGAPGAGGPPPAGAPPAKKYEYEEDRSNWIPPHRFQEVSGARKTLEAQLAEERRRVRALMGLEEDRRTALSPEQQQLRGAFSQMFPELAPLLENPDALRQVIEMARTGRLSEFEQTGDAYWKRHALSVSKDAAARFAKVAGLTEDKLPKGFERRIAGQLMEYISADRTGERYQRYEQGDSSLVDEFVEDLQNVWLNPFRVQANVDAALHVEKNRGLPQRGPAGAVPPQAGGGKKRTRDETRAAARDFVRKSMA